MLPTHCNWNGALPVTFRLTEAPGASVIGPGGSTVTPASAANCAWQWLIVAVSTLPALATIACAAVSCDCKAAISAWKRDSSGSPEPCETNWGLRFTAVTAACVEDFNPALAFRNDVS